MKRQDSLESINATLEQFMEEIPLTIHHQGTIDKPSIIVGVQRGFVKVADKKFGRDRVLMLLDMLEDNPSLLDV